MRIYALLLGVACTTGYGFAADVAVSSVGTRRQVVAETAAPSVADVGGDPTDPVWYGGMIDPITVESAGGATRTAATRGWLLDRPAPRCPATHAGYRATS